ncbi:CMP-N-acetylneuraminate-beta-1,4-galactoside alpha-2,3-sialyltransferase-like [Amphiura filiformis]|uniref:CMP-N-acetylneuraminate-beta-1,4-galactoside alpha-2,3-sialyltransferase-like n=1 Tax=Amphiura filiformis TaxID=82378 RepID=UPI003B21F450
MASKVRTLLYLLLACAVVLLLDLVYLASNSSGRQRNGYSVRRGSKDHGSRWASDNNGALPAGTIAVPINRTEYLNPNKNCSIGKSRQRMVNTYGAKFNASLPAFIDARFIHIPHILKYPPPFGFDNSVPSVFKLLQHLPATGLPADLQRKSCLRCVVVGNGGILRRSALGGVIDNFDVVIRMNDAPTRGFERDVGDKTTIRIFYPESAPKKDKDYVGKDWLFLMMAFKVQDLTWLETMAKGQTLASTKEFWKRPAIKVPKPAKDFRLLNPAIVSETAFDVIGLNRNDGKMKANVPTTGSIAIMVGLRLCDEVAIVGFGYNFNDPNSPMHYYDSIRMNDMKKSWTHDISQEKAMLLQLVQQGIITDLTGGIR